MIPSGFAWVNWLAPVLSRSCAVAPKIVQQKTKPTALRGAFVLSAAVTVAVSNPKQDNRVSPKHMSQNSQDLERMSQAFS